jgi:conjugative transfer signal peptidase TraF
MIRFLRKLGAGFVLLGAGAVCLGAAGARINTTMSIPVGLYWTSSAPIKKGAYVIFYPPKSKAFDIAKKRDYIGAGLCAGGYGLIMKKVLAVKGDTVTVADSGVYVDGKRLPNSKPLKADPSGRLLPHYRCKNLKLSAFEILLMSTTSKLSFDGRYFGPIKIARINSVIRPIFTWQ